MDLLREREAFKKRALAVPVVENRKKDSSQSEVPKKKPSVSTKAPKPPPPKDPFRYKTVGGGGSNSFSILAKIVKYMKTRHLEGETHSLTLDEILDETAQMDVQPRLKSWLQQEALPSNPKIDITEEGKYAFKPPYDIRDRKSLLKLLSKHEQKGLGGILLDDVKESMGNAELALKKLGDTVLQVVRASDRKIVLFYNDKSLQLSIDEELQKLWRSVAVDGVDDDKIEEYLKKQGINSMQDTGPKKINPLTKRKKATAKKARQYKRHNEHLSDVLQEYNVD